MIRVLRMCARSEESLDLAPLRKRHVPSMLMATYDSVSSGIQTLNPKVYSSNPKA